METYKIDVFLNNGDIISQDLNCQNKNYYVIAELTTEQLSAYNNFKALVDGKATITYNQIYVSKDPVIRFVVLNVDFINVNDLQDVYYDDLSDEDKLTFDTFYNTFTV
jgi:hypothetical protein